MEICRSMETILLQNVKGKPYILRANFANHKHFMSVVKCQSKCIHATYILQNLANLTFPFFTLCDFTNKMTIHAKFNSKVCLLDG